MKDQPKFQTNPKPGDIVKIYADRRVKYGTCIGLEWAYDVDHYKRHKEKRDREFCVVQLLDHVPDRVDWWFDEYKCIIKK